MYRLNKVTKLKDRVYVEEDHCCFISLLTIILQLVLVSFSRFPGIFLGITDSRCVITDQVLNLDTNDERF